MFSLQGVRNAWGNTAGFANNNAWFWANPASARMVVCRMKLAECSKFTTSILLLIRT